jgi:protocatechuate 3,4-dioxygenase beta subunit
VNQTIGPFYPVSRPLDQDADLTIIQGRRGRPKGQVIEVVGRVLDLHGRPIPTARLDIWQANAAGRYSHPADDNPAPLDPEFQGSAQFLADAEGRYRFRTIRPGRYPGRVAHIHLDVMGRGQRVITQMYFPDEPGNDGDSVLSGIPAGALRQALISRLTPVTSVPTFQWDVVLGAG